MGPDAALRKYVDISDDNESFAVSHVSGTAGDETVKVTYYDNTTGQPLLHHL